MDKDTARSQVPSADQNRTIRLTLLGRSLTTFDSYVRGPLKNLFLDKSYREELAKRLGEVDARLGKQLQFCLVLLALLIFSDSYSLTKFTVGGLEINTLYPLNHIIVFLLSSAAYGLCFIALDRSLLEQCLNKIYFSVGIFSPKFFYITVFPNNTWTDSLVLRYFGPQSGWGHRIAMFIVQFLTLTPAVVLLFAPSAFAAYYAWGYSVSSAFPFVIRATGAISFILATGGAVTLLMVSLVRVKFTPADFDEATGEATPEFVARIEAEVREQHAKNTPSAPA